uniref:Dimethylhistidine N-methyltransferase n=1 Tax=Candidatus Kentrum sp. SD TaxID=2126332 RepID=A0A450YIJ8_9GAMM|nr:MAG: dimethylhistidine N-methyltransferase [Candidatus Kentron sp. SD]VFK41364.1 MAG: dimethylhistidine N-methyltransferase [Candidatus Kentron sp. SD]VFK80397.1 MAG: dimethylhistidine N-methyltransferase [Candidatus Kentron sp. SD]
MSNITFHDLHPPSDNLKAEVLSGLSGRPKAISPKFFYDQDGSLLFDRITELPEYYPTRAEIGIIEEYRNEMVSLLGEGCFLVELGSGSSKKIRLLLDVLQPATYMPMDISREHLLQSSKLLGADYPHLKIHATCVDYSDDFELPYSPERQSKAAFFPGSSIGNFEPPQARALLQRVAQLLGEGGALLIGVDLKKGQEHFNAAYNDSQGVTAAFNRNLLTRINRELGADFQLPHFEHHAFYNEEQGRVEMHLVSKIAQEVNIDEQTFTFAQGETIHTENSYKYTVEQFHHLAGDANFEAEQVWLDPARLFSTHCLRVKHQ